MEIEVGEEWKIYSYRTRKWEVATVTVVENGRVTMKHRDIPDPCQVDVEMLMSEGGLYRRL